MRQCDNTTAGHQSRKTPILPQVFVDTDRTPWLKATPRYASHMHAQAITSHSSGRKSKTRSKRAFPQHAGPSSTPLKPLRSPSQGVLACMLLSRLEDAQGPARGTGK